MRAVTEFLVISFVQHTLAFITSLFLDRMFAQSMNFYENNIISRFVLSVQSKSSLESSAWIDGCDYQNKDIQKKTTLPLWKNKSVVFFSAVYNKNPCYSTIYIRLYLPSQATFWIFYNVETQQHHASQIRRMQLLLKTIRKKVINCDSDFKWDFALKWRPSWTPS